jgi:hypothetical protein
MSIETARAGAKTDIVIRESMIEATQVEFPATLADGSLQTEKGPYHNLLELLLGADGPVSLKLVLVRQRLRCTR